MKKGMKITLTTEVIVGKQLPIDEEISQLHRAATANKEAKNWDDAVAYLRRANDLMVQSSIDYGIDRWLRLPLFLQQAGKMDEADMYFSWLLADVDRQVENAVGQQSVNVQAATKHSMCAGIYDKWRLAWKREKQSTKAEYCEALAIEQRELAAHYRHLVDSEREQLSFKRRADRNQLQGERPTSTWLPSVHVDIVNNTLNEGVRQDKRYATVTRPEPSVSISPSSKNAEDQPQTAALLVGVVGVVLIVSLLIWIF